MQTAKCCPANSVISDGPNTVRTLGLFWPIFCTTAVQHVPHAATMQVCPGQTAAYLFWKKDWIFFCPVRAAASAIVFCFFDPPLASLNFFAGDFFAGAFGGSALFAWALGSLFWSAAGPTFTVAPPSAAGTASTAQQVKYVQGNQWGATSFQTRKSESGPGQGKSRVGSHLEGLL